MSHPPMPPCLDPVIQPLLQALYEQMSEWEGMAQDPLAVWAREVAWRLLESSPDANLQVDEVLTAADCAFRSIMCSQSWIELLREVLLRPEGFARTLLLMMHGNARRRPSGCPESTRLH